jgi:NAD(P)-dependent dehydrogenase (short-subunit alcohol dehydrogenase family)
LGRLQDKIALITGAGAGLGLAMAKLFAAEGAHVVMADMNEAAATAGAAEINEAGGRALAVGGNVTIQADVDAMAAAVRSIGDRLHVLVNNAGNMPRIDFRHMEDSDWDTVLGPHVWGTVRVTRACLPLLQAANGASVVNLSSIMAERHARQLTGYSAAKAAVAGLSRGLAVELARHAIRVNYLCPGFVPTPLNNRYMSLEPVAKALMSQIPLRRFGTPEEVAKVALFLASDESSYITGEGIAVDGGMALNLA